MATITAPQNAPDLLIGGSSQPSASDERIPVLDPASGEQIAEIPAGAAADADAAVCAAREALEGWRRRDPAERARVLKEGARRLRDHLEELAELQTRENGKPLADSRGGVTAGIETIEQYAELGPLHRGRSLAGGFGATDLMVHEPRGVVALLVPWNDPVAIACGGIAAAAVAGNAVVYKPSEKTPLSGALLAELLELPPGVLNVVLGDERAGRPLVRHPGVDLVMHTGSVATGREIAEACGARLRPAVVELGGKDALVIDAEVDVGWAAEQAASGAFANAGQVCTSVERIYVHAAVAADFTAALVRRAESLRVGPGIAPDSEMGPLIDEEQRELVHRHVTAAVDAGARLLTGGELPGGPGFFYPPTVLADCRDDMDVMREETFGPVAAIRAVESFDEGLAAANASDYGLAASVLTASHEHAQRAWREVRAGVVKVNAVWGGAPGGAAEPRGQSGLGFGYGPELLDEVTAAKVVHLEPAPGASDLGRVG